MRCNRDISIGSPLGSELEALPEKERPEGGTVSQGFHPNLSWSHYRALMRVYAGTPKMDLLLEY
ncbi:MAG: hypothetical protein PF482_20650 [Desulfobacteraceae bacterium]|jgi:hypothetical protein|nr:hypothetical protein [Desulfobacteraceae bacterium]